MRIKAITYAGTTPHHHDYRVSNELMEEALRKCNNDKQRAIKYIAYWVFVGEDRDTYELDEKSIQVIE